jgi:hypothetical protein
MTMVGPAEPPGKYPADAVGKVIDEALGKFGRGPRQLPPDELATALGDALDRWPDDWEPGERDEVSHIIHRLDEIAARLLRRRAARRDDR